MERYIKKLNEGRDLSSEEAENAIGLILSTAKDDEIGEFLLALKAKGEKSEEITGFVRGMKKAAHTIKPRVTFRLVDTCGTGGDGLNTINVSTAAAIVTAAAGIHHPAAAGGDHGIAGQMHRLAGPSRLASRVWRQASCHRA